MFGIKFEVVKFFQFIACDTCSCVHLHCLCDLQNKYKIHIEMVFRQYESWYAFSYLDGLSWSLDNRDNQIVWAQHKLVHPVTNLKIKNFKITAKRVVKTSLQFHLLAMFVSLVFEKIPLCGTFEITIWTWNWFFSSVSQNVSFHGTWTSHNFQTDWTTPLPRPNKNWFFLQLVQDF